MQCQSFWLINTAKQIMTIEQCLVWDIGVLIKCKCKLASSVWLVARTNFYSSSDQSTASHLYSLLWSWLCNFYPHKKPCSEIWSRMNKCMHFVIYLQKCIYVQSLHVECFSQSNLEELRGNVWFSNNKLFLHMFLSIQINAITREMSHFNWVCSLCLSLSWGKHKMH